MPAPSTPVKWWKVESNDRRQLEAGNWRKKTGGRELEVGTSQGRDWRKGTGSREGGRELEEGTGGRELEERNWRQGTGGRELEAGNWKKEDENWRQGAGGKKLAAGNWREVSGGREIEVKSVEVMAFFPESLSYSRVSSKKSKNKVQVRLLPSSFLKAVVVASILWHCFGRSSVRVCDYVISLSHVVDHHSKYS